MIRNTNVRLVCLLAVALAGTSASPNPSLAAGGTNIAYFGLFGLAPGERARLNVVNVSTNTACTLELRVLQGLDDFLPPTTKSLAPGDSTFVLVAQSSSRGRRRFHARVTDVINEQAIDSICIATLEVFSKEGGTVALLQHQ